MPFYIDPVLAVGDFGDVRASDLTIVGTLDSGPGSITGGSSALTVQTPERAGATFPGWLIVAAIVAALFLADRR